jgi:transcriptional regulator of heat shock response
MAKPKYKKSKSSKDAVVKAKSKTKPTKERRDPRIEEVYEEVVEFNCPIRGKVKQKVKIKRFKPLAEQQTKHLIASITELVDKLEEQDDGLSIYSDGEELGIAGTPPVEESE